MRLPWPEFACSVRKKLEGVVYRLDPRTVRLTDPYPRSRSKRQTPVVVLGIVIALAAVLLAASPNAPQKEPIVEAASESVATPPPTPESKTVILPQQASPPPELSTAAPTLQKAAKKQSPKRHPFFYNPFYVFTEEQVERVSVYPLAEPPGLVVDLFGVPEPDRSPIDSVGGDKRLRSVRRRTTKHGLRYILGIITPVKRIEMVHEGGVVMVFPVL